MLRKLAILATLVSAAAASIAGQAIGVLHIKVVLTDKERKATPVPRHALLISDNPSTATPRRVVTTTEGTADVRLPPGNYTVESDQPITFEGRSYQWTQIVNIVAGRDARLELTTDNAEIGAVGSTSSTAGGAPDSDPAFFLKQWQDSVVSLWTPTAHASGFLIDGKGLIATSQRSLGATTSVEVQVTSEVKVPGSVLVSDSRRGVAVLWIDPAAVAAIRPVPLGCASQPPAAVVSGQPIYAIEAPLHQEKGATDGKVSGVEAHAIASDLLLGSGGAGGPAFTAGGSLAGLTEEADDSSNGRRLSARVVRIGDICEAVVAAEQKMKEAAPPKGTRLPVEPPAPFPEQALEEAVKNRVGNLSPYPMVSSDFDIAFMTPLLTYGAQHPPRTNGGGRSGSLMGIPIASPAMRPLVDFANWSEYVAEYPPVVLIRVTPKQVEGFWTKVARGAAQTQGVALPPIKHFKTGFLKMRAFCGDAEVTPIHPFKLEQRVSETEAIYEGLYAFDPAALGPACASVKLMLYSEKEPDKADTRVVDPKVIQQIWQDFAPYRR